MVSATATSLLLFSSSNTSNDEASETAETSDTTGQTWGSLAASITTTLTVIKEALKLSSLSNKHYDSSVDYLDLVHQIRYSLLTDTEDKQEVEYQDYSARFYHIRQQSSALPLPRILDTFLSAAKEGGDGNLPLFEVTWDDDVKFARYARMLFPNDRTGRPRLSQTVAATVLGYIFDTGPFCGLDFKKWIEKFVYGMFQKDFKGIPRGDGGGLPKTRNRVYPVKPVFDMLHPILPTTKHDIPDEGKDDGIDNMGEEESETEGPPRGSPPSSIKRGCVYMSPEQREILDALKFHDQFYKIESEFNSTELSMPSIPFEAMSSHHSFITWRSILRKGKTQFKLKRNPVVDEKDPYQLHKKPLVAEINTFKLPAFANTTRSERMLLLLHDIFCMSAEYCDVHYTLAESYNLKLRRCQLFCLAASAFITIILLYFDSDHPRRNEVSIAVGALAAVVGTVLSWTKFASYDSLATNHKIAYGRFYGTCSSIEILFLQLKRLIADVDRDVVLETLDSILLEAENDGNGVNNEGYSGMVSDKSDKPTPKEDKDTHPKEDKDTHPKEDKDRKPLEEDFNAAINPKFDYAYHTTPASPTGGCFFDIAPGEDADGQFTSEELLEPQTKMQLILKKAFQYRIFNAMETSRLRFLADTMTFFALLLSGVSSILLLTSYNEASIVIAATLSAVVTALTGYQSYMEFESRYTSHASSVRVFANLQREIMSSLMVESEEKITEDLVDLTAKLAAAVQAMPIVSPETIEGYKDEATTGNDMMFPELTNLHRWNESMEHIESMRNMGIFTTLPDLGKKEEAKPGIRRRTSFKSSSKK